MQAWPLHINILRCLIHGGALTYHRNQLGYIAGGIYGGRRYKIGVILRMADAGWLERDPESNDETWLVSPAGRAVFERTTKQFREGGNNWPN